MTEAACERFIAAQLAGLKALGLNDAALAREAAMLRSGLAQREMLSRLLETRHAG